MNKYEEEEAYVRDCSGQRKREWQLEAETLHARLDGIQQMQQQTHDALLTHIQDYRQTRVAMEELVILWKGSKMMVSAAKLIIPILAALGGFIAWTVDKWKQ